MELSTFFRENPKAAVAFSGGTDSAYLLYAAAKYGASVRAYFVKTAFQPQFELDDARRMAEYLHADMSIIETDILDSEEITANAPERCYFCKKAIFSRIIAAAAKDGFTLLLDGTNASDGVSDRPGMKALKELSIRSPLRECGLTKDKIRQLSKDAGLFTWDKPAYACLATRIPTGMKITADSLFKTEHAENYLHSLGFRDFRIRLLGTAARIQLPQDQLSAVLEHRLDIVTELKKYYPEVLLDLEVRE